MKSILIIVTAIIAYSLARPQESDVNNNDHPVFEWTIKSQYDTQNKSGVVNIANLPYVLSPDNVAHNRNMMVKATDDITGEDNTSLVKLNKCYWDLLKFENENGVSDCEEIHQLLVLATIDIRSQIVVICKLIEQTIEHCKNIPNDDSAALDNAKYKNCMVKFLKDTGNNSANNIV